MSDREPASATRRAVLAAGLVGLLGGSRRAGGAAPPLVVPEVDGLTLQVVDDAAIRRR